MALDQVQSESQMAPRRRQLKPQGFEGLGRKWLNLRLALQELSKDPSERLLQRCTSTSQELEEWLLETEKRQTAFEIGLGQASHDAALWSLDEAKQMSREAAYMLGILGTLTNYPVHVVWKLLRPVLRFLLWLIPEHLPQLGRHQPASQGPPVPLDDRISAAKAVAAAEGWRHGFALAFTADVATVQLTQAIWSTMAARQAALQRACDLARPPATEQGSQILQECLFWLTLLNSNWAQAQLLELGRYLHIAEGFTEPILFWLEGSVCASVLQHAHASPARLEPGYAAQYARHLAFAKRCKPSDKLASVVGLYDAPAMLGHRIASFFTSVIAANMPPPASASDQPGLTTAFQLQTLLLARLLGTGVDLPTMEKKAYLHRLPALFSMHLRAMTLMLRITPDDDLWPDPNDEGSSGAAWNEAVRAALSAVMQMRAHILADWGCSAPVEPLLFIPIEHPRGELQICRLLGLQNICDASAIAAAAIVTHRSRTKGPTPQSEQQQQGQQQQQQQGKDEVACVADRLQQWRFPAEDAAAAIKLLAQFAIQHSNPRYNSEPSGYRKLLEAGLTLLGLLRPTKPEDFLRRWSESKGWASCFMAVTSLIGPYVNSSSFDAHLTEAQVVGDAMAIRGLLDHMLPVLTHVALLVRHASADRAAACGDDAVASGSAPASHTTDSYDVPATSEPSVLVLASAARLLQYCTAIAVRSQPGYEILAHGWQHATAVSAVGELAGSSAGRHDSTTATDTSSSAAGGQMGSPSDASPSTVGEADNVGAAAPAPPPPPPPPSSSPSSLSHQAAHEGPAAGDSSLQAPAVTEAAGTSAGAGGPGPSQQAPPPQAATAADMGTAVVATTRVDTGSDAPSPVSPSAGALLSTAKVTGASQASTEVSPSSPTAAAAAGAGTPGTAAEAPVGAAAAGPSPPSPGDPSEAGATAGTSLSSREGSGASEDPSDVLVDATDSVLAVAVSLLNDQVWCEEAEDKYPLTLIDALMATIQALEMLMRLSANPRSWTVSLATAILSWDSPPCTGQQSGSLRDGGPKDSLAGSTSRAAASGCTESSTSAEGQVRLGASSSSEQVNSSGGGLGSRGVSPSGNLVSPDITTTQGDSIPTLQLKLVMRLWRLLGDARKVADAHAPAAWMRPVEWYMHRSALSLLWTAEYLDQMVCDSMDEQARIRSALSHHYSCEGCPSYENGCPCCQRAWRPEEEHRGAGEGAAGHDSTGGQQPHDPDSLPPAFLKNLPGLAQKAEQEALRLASLVPQIPWPEVQGRVLYDRPRWATSLLLNMGWSMVSVHVRDVQASLCALLLLRTVCMLVHLGKLTEQQEAEVVALLGGVPKGMQASGSTNDSSSCPSTCGSCDATCAGVPECASTRTTDCGSNTVGSSTTTTTTAADTGTTAAPVGITTTTTNSNNSSSSSSNSPGTSSSSASATTLPEEPEYVAQWREAYGLSLGEFSASMLERLLQISAVGKLQPVSLLDSLTAAFGTRQLPWIAAAQERKVWRLPLNVAPAPDSPPDMVPELLTDDWLRHTYLGWVQSTLLRIINQSLGQQ